MSLTKLYRSRACSNIERAASLKEKLQISLAVPGPEHTKPSRTLGVKKFQSDLVQKERSQALGERMQKAMLPGEQRGSRPQTPAGQTGPKTADDPTTDKTTNTFISSFDGSDQSSPISVYSDKHSAQVSSQKLPDLVTRSKRENRSVSGDKMSYQLKDLLPKSIRSLHGQALERFLGKLSEYADFGNQDAFHFHVDSVDQYEDWEARNEAILDDHKPKYELTGCSDNLTLIITVPTPVHDIGKILLREIIIDDATLKPFIKEADTEEIPIFEEDPNIPERMKLPDFAIRPKSDEESPPTFIAETGNFQSTSSLFERAMMWLTKTDNQVKLVFLFDVKHADICSSNQVFEEGEKDKEIAVSEATNTERRGWQKKAQQWDRENKLRRPLMRKVTKIIFSAWRQDPEDPRKVVECLPRVNFSTEIGAGRRPKYGLAVYPKEDDHEIFFDLKIEDLLRNEGEYPIEMRARTFPIDIGRIAELLKNREELERKHKAHIRVGLWMRSLGLKALGGGPLQTANDSKPSSQKRKYGIEMADEHFKNFIPQLPETGDKQGESVVQEENQKKV